MKNILKHKKIIVFILVFTISFGVVTSYKQKNVQAIAIVDDILFWTLGALVLSSGIIAVSDYQLPDMGKMVYDNFKLRGHTDAELMEEGIKGVGYVLKIGSALKSAINYVSDFISKNNVDKSVEYSLPFTNHIILPVSGFPLEKYDSVSTIWEDLYNNSLKLLTLNVTVSGYFKQVGSGNWSGKYAAKGGTINYVGYSSTNGRNTVSVIYRSPSGQYSSFGGIDNPSIFDAIIETNGAYEVVGYESIPYSNPKIKENYSEEKLNNNLPYTDEKQGYYPIPSVIPNYPTTTSDNPLTWETVKNDVIPLEQEKEIDWTGGEPEQDPGDEDTPDLWKWLTRILRWLFSPLRQVKNILTNLGEFLAEQFKTLIDNIKNIPNVFSNFFENLGDKIANLPSLLTSPFSGLFRELFVPDLPPNAIFSFPEGSFFGNVVELFNYSALFNITPKPIEFETSIPYGLGEKKKTWDISLKPFSLPYINNNLEIFRNVMSYSILIMVLWAIVHHLLPKRDMD